MPEYAWNSRAKAVKCPQCSAWTLVGITPSGRKVCVSVAVVTPQNAAEYLGASRRMYAVDPDGCLTGPLTGRSAVPMAAWRPLHPCGLLDGPERPVAASVADPCPFAPGRPGFGCQRLTRSVTGCTACTVGDEPVPFELDRPGRVCPGVPGGSRGPSGYPDKGQGLRGPENRSPGFLSPAELDAHAVSLGRLPPLSAAEHLLCTELGAVVIERTNNKSGRVIYRDSRYIDERNI